MSAQGRARGGFHTDASFALSKEIVASVCRHERIRTWRPSFDWNFHTGFPASAVEITESSARNHYTGLMGTPPRYNYARQFGELLPPAFLVRCERKSSQDRTYLWIDLQPEYDGYTSAELARARAAAQTLVTAIQGYLVNPRWRKPAERDSPTGSNDLQPITNWFRAEIMSVPQKRAQIDPGDIVRFPTVRSTLVTTHAENFIPDGAQAALANSPAALGTAQAAASRDEQLSLALATGNHR